MTHATLPHRPQPLSYDAYFEALRQREYARLDLEGHVYLDYTGGNLPAARQLDDHHALLRKSTLGNPHSTNPTSRHATALIARTRRAVLDFFGAGDDYYCVFTPNASGALKLVGENYVFGTGSHYLMLADNHNSVNGIREYAQAAGARFSTAPVHRHDLTIDEDFLRGELDRPAGPSPRLFAYPAQSNVSGVRHSLDWIGRAQALGWDVLLDAAAFAPGNPLHLRACRPDFVCVSFYKIFGYPTGLGCLLVRKDKFARLRKRWFAGGTVRLASVAHPDHRLLDGPERFEDGTLNYLDLPALKIGLDYVSGIGMERIRARTAALTNYLYDRLRELRHPDGSPAVRIFGPEDRGRAGGTLVMAFYDAAGRRFPFEEVEARANRRRISLRSGCFCNPGLDEIISGVSGVDLRNYFAALAQADYASMIASLGHRRGATRISVGLATVRKDLNHFLDFVRSLMRESVRAATV